MKETIKPNVKPKSKLLPKHNCKEHLQITDESHLLVSHRNVVFGLYYKCSICAKIILSDDVED